MLNHEPRQLWEFFEEICRIPRASGFEKEVGKYVVSIAKGMGLPVKKDRVGNIIIEVPATENYENKESILLQCHLDMVCEKNADVTHDFTKDPIKPISDGTYIRAEGTTLGADNGIGISTCLAILYEKDFIHGPLELLFTIDEETGLKGASNLLPESFKARKMINLDTEEDGAIYIGCSGGRDTVYISPIKREETLHSLSLYKLMIKGLRGGHSGVDIHEGRANANQILARILRKVSESIEEMRIIEAEGGSKRNAIPREAWAVISIDPNNFQKLADLIAELQAMFRDEYHGVDGGITLEISESISASSPLTVKSQKKLLNLLFTIPHGVLSMSNDIPSLVETSTNFATIKTNKTKIEIGTSQRSSISSKLEWASALVSTIGKLGGAKIKQSEPYPGWKPNLTSPLLKKASEVYEEMFNNKPVIKAIHAGLECGVIGERVNGMDMISIGPQIENAHSPDERVVISTVSRYYEYLKKLISVIAES